jgi:hypothetical protein
MRISVLLALVLGAGMVAAGCGGKTSGPPRTTLDNLTVKGENLSKANSLYTQGNQLYMGGGVGVAEKQRKSNLAKAIKCYEGAQAIYRKALRRHPDDMSLQNRVREVDMHIDGCKRMMNLNISGGKGDFKY